MPSILDLLPADPIDGSEWVPVAQAGQTRRTQTSSIGGAGAIGDITGVTAGAGLTGGGTNGTVSLNVSFGSVAGTVASGADARLIGALQTTGGTMTGALTLSGAPTAPLHAATKAYVDSTSGGGGSSDASTLPSLSYYAASGYTPGSGGDDYPALSAAMTAGGKVRLPKGTLLLSAPITVPDGAFVEGSGTTIKPTASMTTMLTLSGKGRIANVSCVNQSGFATNAFAVTKAKDNNRLSIIDCEVIGFTNGWLVTNGDVIRWERPRGDTCGTFINLSNGGMNSAIVEPYFVQGNGIDVGVFSTVQCEGMQVFGGQILPATNGAFAVRLKSGLSISFLGVIFDQIWASGANGVLIDGTGAEVRHITFDGCWFGKNATATGTGSLFKTVPGSVQDINLTDCEFQDAGTYGLELTAGNGGLTTLVMNGGRFMGSSTGDVSLLNSRATFIGTRFTHATTTIATGGGQASYSHVACRNEGAAFQAPSLPYTALPYVSMSPGANFVISNELVVLGGGFDVTGASVVRGNFFTGSSGTITSAGQLIVQANGFDVTGDSVVRGTLTTTGTLTLPGSPTAPLHAATKAYVDSSVGSAGGGTITGVTAGTGLTGGGSTGTVSLALDATSATFLAGVRSALLTGLTTATNAVIAATDSVLTAFGKLQAQVSANSIITALFQKDTNYGVYSTTDQAAHLAHVVINATEAGGHTTVDSALLGGQFIVHGSNVASPDPVTCNWIAQFSMIKQGWPSTTNRGELDGISVVTRNTMDDTSAFIGNVGTTTGFGVILEGVTNQFDSTGAVLRSVRAQLCGIEGGTSGSAYSAGLCLIADSGTHDVGLQIQSTSGGVFNGYLKFINQLAHVFFSVDGFGNIGIANYANTDNIVIGIDTGGAFSLKGTGSVTELLTVDQSGNAVISRSLQTQLIAIIEGGTTSAVHFSISAANNTGGAVIQLTGNGTTTPAKTIRVRGGVLEFVNSANTAIIATLSDAGTLSVPDINVASTDAVAGAWNSTTGTLGAGSGSLGAGNSATIRYKKVGRIVHMNVVVTMGASGQGTGAQYVSLALPWTAAARTSLNGAEHAVNGLPITGRIDAGSSSLLIYSSSNGFPGVNSASLVLNGIMEASS